MGRSKKRKGSMPSINYQQLRAEMRKQLEQDNTERSSNQVFSNLNSALNQYLAGLAIPIDAVVGIEFRTSYYKLTARHFEASRASGRSEQSLRDRKSLLKRWRILFLKLDTAQSAEERMQSPFVRALSEALPAGTSLTLLAKQAGVPYSALQRWRHGVIPTTRSFPAVRRLERFLALPEGQLMDVIGSTKGGKHDEPSHDVKIAYRERIGRLRLSPYRLKAVTDLLRHQWAELIEYKSSLLTFGLKRAERGQWSPSPLHPGKDQITSRWFSFTEQGEHIPAAETNWGYTAAFLGWLNRYGGHSENAAQTLAWFADSSILGKYLAWYIQRSAGKAHEGHVSFVSFALSLVHPETGYLTQSPDLRLTLPGDVSVDKWAELCHTAFMKLKEHKKTLKRAATKSRDPNEPVAQVLKLEDPLLALKDMRARQRAARPTAGTYTEAVWGRDMALIGLLLCSPLRAKNIRHLTYRPDGTGHLRRKNDGFWELFIPRTEFKNRNGAAMHRDYRIELDPGIYPDLLAYLDVYRPLLLQSKPFITDLLFVTTKRGLENLPWKSMNRHVEALTKKYLMQCPGVGPHAIRHIVTTSIVKKSGEFSTAALVLHDKEETVRKNYTHLLSEDGHTRYRKLFPGLFNS